MAKAKQWEDVRLLSFDLQTVEFTYASVREAATYPIPASPHHHPHRNLGLHALYIMQRPTPHRRIIQPPIRASFTRSSTRRGARHPPKPTRRSRALPTRPPPPGPTSRRTTRPRIHPPRHRTSPRSPNTHLPLTPNWHPRDTESGRLVARHVQQSRRESEQHWRYRATRVGLSCPYGFSRRYARRFTIGFP